MSNDSFLPFFLVRILHSLVIFAILGVFGFNLFTNIKSLGLIAQVFNVTTVNELVPPALTFCITREIGYAFTIEIYNQTVDEKDRTTYLKPFPGNSKELASLGGRVARCWVLSPPVGSDRALIKNPPPVANVDDMVLTTTRFFDAGNDVITPLLVNIFDPLERENLFQFNKFLLLDPDINRVIQFTRTRHIDINGNVVHDIKYNIIDEFRSPDQTVPGVSSANKFTFRAASFDVDISKEQKVTTIWTVIFNALTFLGVLIGRIYFPLVGHGKYRPWGFINQLVGYYPIEHIIRSPKEEEEGWAKSNENLNMSGQSNSPRIEEKLEIYLERIGKAKYLG